MVIGNREDRVSPEREDVGVLRRGVGFERNLYSCSAPGGEIDFAIVPTVALGARDRLT